MIKFINKNTGGYMFIDESREKEYLEAGHKLASDIVDVEIKKNKAPVKKLIKKGK